MRRIPSFVFAALSVACLVGPVCAQSQKDRDAFLRIKAALEEAIDKNRPESAAPFLAPDFSGEMLGQRMNGPAGFADALKRSRRDVEKGKVVDGYEIRIHPDMDKLAVDGDIAAASGTTEERIHTPAGWMTFRSQWTASLMRTAAGWKLSRMQSHFDPSLTITASLSRAVRELWSPIGRLNFRGVRVQSPDYDGDNKAFLRKG